MSVMSSSAASALVINDLTKSFGATRALRSISLQIGPGVVHALLGHNGSGKSTLIKTLGGYHAPDAGTIFVYGQELPPKHSGDEAHAAGLRFVHQDLGLVADLSVAENLALGASYKKAALGSISWRGQYRQASIELQKLHLRVDPRRMVQSLGPIEQTLVAITRALQDMDHHRGVLILDEPTARLPRSEVTRLLEIIQKLKGEGVCVVYVTHRLDEVFEVADEVTILRDGERVFSGAISETDEATVRSLIAGRKLTDSASVDRRSVAGDPMVAEIRGLTGPRVHDVDLKLHAGEMVALVGLVGSGRSELGRLIYGLQPATGGSVSVGGGPAVTKPTPGWAASAGMAYVPQERQSGLALPMTIAENLAVTSYAGLGRWYGVSQSKIAKMATRVVDRFRVKPAQPSAVVGTLSGGNQQKVALGKWVRLDCSLLIMDEPLQGIDVGAKIDIMETIRERVLARGGAVLWLESDIEYVPKYADRVLIMRDGHIAAEIPSQLVSREHILNALYGGEQQ